MAFSSDNLQVFLAVLDHGSFSAAARRLGRVPSAVSMTMANLEAELDLLLFTREGREPKPTAAALALEPQARALATQFKQLEAHALALHQGLERRLTLAIATELLTAPWSEALAEVSRLYPDLEVEVLGAQQVDALAMLHSGRADVALAFERHGMDEREAFLEVGRETLVAVISPQHPAFVKARRRWRDADLINTRQVEVASRDLSVTEPRFVYARQCWRCDTPIASLRLIEAGIGWGWLPREFARPYVAAGSLVEIPLVNMTNGLSLWVDVVWSTERPLGLAARRFIELMQAQRSASKPGAQGVRKSDVRKSGSSR